MDPLSDLRVFNPNGTRCETVCRNPAPWRNLAAFRIISYTMKRHDEGACGASHNPKVEGSNPSPATRIRTARSDAGRPISGTRDARVPFRCRRVAWSTERFDARRVSARPNGLSVGDASCDRTIGVQLRPALFPPRNCRLAQCRYRNGCAGIAAMSLSAFRVGSSPAAALEVEA